MSPDTDLDSFSTDLDGFIKRHRSNPAKADLAKLNNLINSLQTKLTGLDKKQHHRIQKQLSILKKTRQSINRYRYFEEKLKKEQEDKRRELNEEALARVKESNEQTIDRMKEELDHLFDEIRGTAKETSMTIEFDVDKFIGEMQEGFEKRLKEIEEIERQIKLEVENITELEELILNSGFLTRLSDLSGVSINTLQENFEKCRYSQNPNLRTKDEFINELVNLSGITNPNHIEQTKKIVTELNLDDEFHGREEGIGNTEGLVDQRTRRYTKNLEELLTTSRILTSIPEGEAKEKLREFQNYMLSKINPESFTSYLESKAHEINALPDRLKSYLEIPDNEGRQVKIKQELRTELDLLLEDTREMIGLAEKRFGSNSEEFTKLAEMQTKLESRAEGLQELHLNGKRQGWHKSNSEPHPDITQTPQEHQRIRDDNDIEDPEEDDEEHPYP